MVDSPIRAVLDANVLFPFLPRDTLLRAAARDHFQVYWSEEILHEARRNLVGKHVVTAAHADRLIGQMQSVFPEAMVTGHKRLIRQMRNQIKDRHVAAVAVRANASIIVTQNLRDFRDLPSGITAHTAEQFLVMLFERNPAGMIAALESQAHAMRQPPMTLHELLSSLARSVPAFAKAVRVDLKTQRS